MKKLTLPLIKHWYNLTDDGIKKEDYREITIYWAKRFITLCKADMNYNDLVLHLTGEKHSQYYADNIQFKRFDVNRMTLGYPKSTDKSRIIEFEHAGIEIGFGIAEWGADPNKNYFIIKHGKKF